MVEIKDNAITLTRGDTLSVEVEIIKDGAPYAPTGSDSVAFALKRAKYNADGTDFADAEPLVKKDIPVSTMQLLLEPEDTKSLAFGKYKYDIEITFADGTVSTFIANEDFTIAPEVYNS